MFSGVLTLRPGKPFKVAFTATGSDVPSTTGYNFKMSIRTNLGAADPALLVIDSGGGSPNATVSESSGQKVATTNVSAAVTAAIAGPADKEALWVADAEFYHANGDVVDLGSYRVNWQPKVT